MRSYLFPGMSLLLMASTAMGAFYRYIDLTPTMEMLPRGKVEADLADVIRCFEVIEEGDSVTVSGQDRGSPVSVFSLSHELVVVRGDSLVRWIMDDLTYHIELDDTGRPLLLSRLDPEGEPFPGSDGAAFVEWVWLDDSTVRVYSLDSSMAHLPVKLSPLYSGRAVKINENGELENFYWQPVIARGFQYVLDENHRALVKKAVDGEGNTVLTSDGMRETRYTYDSRGNTVSTAYYDRRGGLLPREYILPLEGNWEFDSLGVVLNDAETAYIEREYDHRGLYVSERNTGVNGEPVEDPQGRALTLYRRDPPGGIAESTWFGLQGEPVEVAGVWATRRTFDGMGRVLETTTWNASGEITEFPGGFARTRFSYHPEGNVRLISYFDRENRPVINTVMGCHGREHMYDHGGNLVEVLFLDTSLAPVENAAGYARVVYEYDENGELIRELLYDIQGVPLN